MIFTVSLKVTKTVETIAHIKDKTKPITILLCHTFMGPGTLHKHIHTTNLQSWNAIRFVNTNKCPSRLVLFTHSINNDQEIEVNHFVDCV